MNDTPSYEYAVPPAGSLIEALRGIGYDIKTAIADLVDNSISAKASNVWVHFHWIGRDSFITILDDGRGMAARQLAEAMRPGSQNPLEARAPDDLGRFGLGLKTASFSQCRRLTVASRQRSGEISVRCWDLDYVVTCNEWRILKDVGGESKDRLVPLEMMSDGTLVLWECLDHMVGDADVDDEKLRTAFQLTADSVRDHLGMVFHRFLEGSRPSLRIFVNGRGDEHRVLPWDPFLADHPSTISTPVDSIPSVGGRVEVQGFVLPHKDRLGEELHRRASGPDGWNAHQGFYVYRNRRLLVPGSWLGLGAERPWTKEEHYKLARIRLDLPNSMDSQWKIDVKKSRARPPVIVRRRLKELADHVRKQARDVFVHRGSYQPRPTAEPITRTWKQQVRDGRVHYAIDRSHPVVAACLAEDRVDREEIKRMLRLIETSVPIHRIWLDMAERPGDQAGPKESLNEAEVLPVMQALYVALRLTQGLSIDTAHRELLRLEPFNAFPHLVEQLVEPVL